LPFLKALDSRADSWGMGVEFLLANAAGVVSLYACLFHAWVFVQHPRALDHAWVALAAAGACIVSLGTALVYSADGPAAAMVAQRVQGVGSPIVTLGALLFAMERLDVRAPALVRAAVVVTAAVFALAVAAPELLFASGPDRYGVLAQQHGATVALSPVGATALGALLVFFVTPLVLCVRAVRRGHPAAKPLCACFAAWTAAGLSDTAVGVGLYHHPFLMPTGGYVAVSVAFSAILLRDLALATAASEQRGDRLLDEARERDDALRAIDLRLARGEQLAAIGTLAAGVAHEINNPLAYVSANLNQLRALHDEDHDPDEVKEILAECREGLGRVAAIVTDLLRMGRQGDDEHESCDLGDVMRGLLPLVLREAGDRVEIVTDLQSPLPVVGHPRLLRQAVLNLALNAVHAVRDLSDRPPRIELSAYADHGSAVIGVRDDGPGIPPALRARIFEPSFTTKAEGSGSGLGLALTRLVVTRHGGQIDVESDADGTAITIRLPLAPPS
jgi:signal transduction histidine kinase